MTGIPRNQVLYDGAFFHVVWQCHNRSWLFQDERIKRLYYDLLLKYRADYQLEFHAYHFMENHIHLVGRTATLEAFSGFFRLTHNLFARQVNRRMRRRGQVVMERLKSPSIQDDRHLLAVMAYCDLNGVRAGRDSGPGESPWSSYRYYAHGRADSLILPAPSYLALSDDPRKRQAEYRAIVDSVTTGNEPLVTEQTPRSVIILRTYSG